MYLPQLLSLAARSIYPPCSLWKGCSSIFSSLLTINIYLLILQLILISNIPYPGKNYYYTHLKYHPSASCVAGNKVLSVAVSPCSCPEMLATTNVLCHSSIMAFSSSMVTKIEHDISSAATQMSCTTVNILSQHRSPFPDWWRPACHKNHLYHPIYLKHHFQINMCLHSKVPLLLNLSLGPLVYREGPALVLQYLTLIWIKLHLPFLGLLVLLITIPP